MKRVVLIVVVILLVLMAGCHRHSRHGEGWGTPTATYSKTRDGYYRVRKGDTLHAIAFNYGLDWRDIASWNHIPSPYLIYPDQELRLSPPGQPMSSGSSRTTTGVTTAGTQSAPTSRTEPSNGSATTSGLKTPSSSTITTAPAREPAVPSTTPAAATPGPSASTATSPSTSTPETRSTSPAPSVAGSADPTQWLWPTNGRVVSNFKANDPARNGIEITGEEGQPILASAAGEVVYSGNGLIGYGELIIIKHSDRMLSAYAHNRQRLVSEGDRVSAGRKIAEMGRDERNKPILHFEIRINGNPGDPLNYLPPR